MPPLTNSHGAGDPGDMSPEPGVPQTADKANIGGIVSGGFLLVGLFLVFYFDEKNGTNFGEILVALGVALLGGGATHAAVFKTKNRRKRPKAKRA